MARHSTHRLTAGLGALALLGAGFATAPAAAAPVDDDRESASDAAAPEAPEATTAIESGSDAPAPEAEAPESGSDAAPEEAPEAEEAPAETPDEEITADAVTLDLVAITDLHGHIENTPYLQTAINGFRSDNPDGTFFVSTGDHIGGSAFVSAVADDVPTIEILNAMGHDYSAVGNHEFDQGIDDLIDRVLPLTEFTYLGANVQGDAAAAINTPQFVTEDVGAITVAFIGTVTQETPGIVAPGGIAGLTFLDEVDVANQAAAAASEEADVVVAMIHEDADLILPRLSEDIDAVFAGHSHLDKVRETPSGAPVVQADHYGLQLGHIELEVDPETGEVETVTAVNLPMYRTEQDEEGDDIQVPNYEADPEIQAMFETAEEASEELGQREVGTVTAPFNRAARDGQDNGTNRGGESTLGNLLGDVALFAANEVGLDADIGVINPGGIRADLDPNNDGTVTYREAFDVQPFGNTIGAVTILGSDLYTILEQQYRGSGGHPYLALGWSDNLDYVYDPGAAAGRQILHLTIDGEPVADTDQIRIAGNTFLLDGGDQFSGFVDNATNFVDTGNMDVQALIDYLEANPGLSPTYEQRSIGWTGPLTAKPGDTVTVTLSGLSFTSEDDPLPADVAVELDGTEIGATTEIDHTPSDGYNNTGVAEVELTFPEDLAEGDYTLTVFAGATEADVPFTLAIPVLPKAGVGFYLNDGWGPHATHVFAYGRVGDEVFVGDWDGDGADSLAVRRGNTFYFSNTLGDGYADIETTFGRAGDEVLVGDWDGDGTDTLGVRRGNAYFLTNSFAGGWADEELTFGRASDEVFVGDWDADEVDTLGVRRGNAFFLSNSFAGGWAEEEFTYGRASDVVLVGDWDGDGIDTFAVRRGNRYLIANTLTPRWADIDVTYGRASDEVFVGDWDGDGEDTLGIRR